MIYKESHIFDNEFIIMSEVSENNKVTQRELSRKLGVSVSTVNLLMNKMIREGLTKMSQVSQKQVLYMLTPKGMMEKAKKTVKYLKLHYKAIYEMKEKVKDFLEKIYNEYDAIYILISNDETGEIIKTAVTEYTAMIKKAKVIPIYSIVDIDRNFRSAVLIHMNVNDEINRDLNGVKYLKIINLANEL